MPPDWPWTLNHPEQTLQLCQQVLKVEPGHEEAHRLAMRSFAAEGRPRRRHSPI